MTSSEKPNHIQQLTEKRDIDALVKLLADESQDVAARQLAAEALGQLKARQAVGPLSEAVDHDEYQIRKAAAIALGQIGDPQAVAPLVQAIYATHVGARYNVYYPISDDAHQAILQIGPAAIPGLLAALKDPDRLVVSNRDPVVELFVDLGQAAVPALIRTLSDRSPFVRCQAAEALGRLEDARAVDKLRLALSDQHDFVREAAVRALGQIGQEESLPDLMKALEDKEDRVKKAAIWAVSQFQNEPTDESLIQALQADYYGIRVAAVQGLGRPGNEAAVDTLIAALKDTDGRVCAAALQALETIGGERAITAIAQAVVYLPSSSTAEMAKRILNKSDRPEAKVALNERAQFERMARDLRLSAAAILGQLNPGYQDQAGDQAANPMYEALEVITHLKTKRAWLAVPEITEALSRVRQAANRARNHPNQHFSQAAETVAQEIEALLPSPAAREGPIFHPLPAADSTQADNNNNLLSWLKRLFNQWRG